MQMTVGHSHFSVVASCNYRPPPATAMGLPDASPLLLLPTAVAMAGVLPVTHSLPLPP